MQTEDTEKGNKQFQSLVLALAINLHRGTENQEKSPDKKTRENIAVYCLLLEFFIFSGPL